MKILLCVMCIIFCTNITYAATKCIAYDETTTGTGYSAPNSQPDWKVFIHTNTSTFTAQGIGVCSNTGATTGAETATKISIGASNRYCWCKMTWPKISQWLYLYNHFEGASGYANYCARDCASSVQDSATFRDKMFTQ